MSTEVKTSCKSYSQIELLEKAKSLPLKPGCYLMKKANGDILYVGKSKALRSRVSSYFNSSAKTPKTEILVGHICDFDFILTSTEAEALVLENNLIKKHRPRYNVMLRDDKSYPYIVVDSTEPYPRPVYKRRFRKKKGLQIFGPFVHGTNISEVLRVVMKSFGLRDCDMREFNSRKNPCLLYQIDQCTAPCVGRIEEQDYQYRLKMALDFFNGKLKKPLNFLQQEMEKCANEEKFEAAAALRDHIELLQGFHSQSHQENAELYGKHKNVDIASFFVGETEVDLCLYFIRNNVLLGHKNFHFLNQDFEELNGEAMVSLLYQYYSSNEDHLPEQIVLAFEDDEIVKLEEALSSMKKINVSGPIKEFESLIHLTTENAKETQLFRKRNEDSPFTGLITLQRLLKLKERPSVLECYDIAIFQGKSPAASQIVFIDGKAVKKGYRHYHLQEREEGNNDFAMMEEVISRRIKHGNLPDIFVVDGGKGQVSSFKKILEENDIDIPVVGIAKKKNDKEERLIIPGRVNSFILKKDRSLFRTIVQMRDEAHRFSRRLHHKAEEKRTLTSWIDRIEGIGPKTKKKIMTQMSGSFDQLALLEVEEISEKFQINKKIAEKIKKALS